MFYEECINHKAENRSARKGAVMFHYCKDKIIKKCDGCKNVKFKKAARRVKRIRSTTS